MLAQKLILSYSTKIFVQILQIAASIVVARIAGPSVLGTMAFGLAYVTMFTFVADLGFGTAYIKKLSEGNKIDNYLATYTRIKLLLIFCYTLFVIGFFLLQKFIFNVAFESIEHVYVIFILLGTQIVTQILSIPKTTFNAYTQQAKADIPDLISSSILQILRVIIVLLGYKAIELAVGNLFAAIIIAPLVFYLFKDVKFGKFDKNIAREYYKIALPVMLTAFTSTFVSTADKVLLQFYTNSEQVGYYTAGFRIGGFVLMISQSVGLLFYPIFSNAAKNSNTMLIVELIKKFERFSFLFIMPFLILSMIIAKEIVFILLGQEYEPSISIMMLINLAMFINVLISPYGSLIVGLGHFNIGLKITIIHFVFFIIILLILINTNLLNLGINGAALAILFGNLFMLLLYIYYCKKSLSILSFNSLRNYIIFGIINFSIFLFLYKQLNLSAWIAVVFFSLGYLILTYTSMAVTKLMDKSDLKFLKLIFNMSEMKKYVKREVKNNLGD